MSLLGDICDQLHDQRREIEQLKACIVGQDALKQEIEQLKNKISSQDETKEELEKLKRNSRSYKYSY